MVRTGRSCLRGSEFSTRWCGMMLTTQGSDEMDGFEAEPATPAGVSVAPVPRGSRLAEVLGRDPTPVEELAFALGKVEGVNSAT